MQSKSIPLSIKIGLITAEIILLFEVSNLLLVYKYFRFDYYLTAVAVLFLIAGFFLSKWRLQKNDQPTPDISLQNLTSKELQILQLIIEGKSNKEIAAANFVEISTIKTHINNLYSKLEINSRREAVNKFKGVLNPDL